MPNIKNVEKVIPILKKIVKYSIWIIGQSKSSLLSIFIYTAGTVILSLTSVLMALASKQLFDSAQYGRTDTLMQTGFFIVGVVMLQTVSESFLSVYYAKLSTVLTNRIKQQLFDKLSKTQWLDFTKYHSGDLLTRMTDDVETVTDGVTSVIPNMISLVCTLFASMLVLFLFDPLLSLLAFALGPVSVLFTRLFGKKLKDFHLRIQEAESTYRSFVQEFLKNMHIIKTFRLENHSGVTLDDLQNKKVQWIVKRSKFNAVASALLTFSYSLGFLLALLWSSIKLSQGTATFGTITLFLQLVNQIQGPFVSLAQTIPSIIVMYASAGRLMPLYDLERENFTDKILQWRVSGIRSKDLEFSYNNETPVLHNFNFDINPGELVAVVGASGEGKTTFIRLLLSLLKPTSGNLIFYNPETHEEQPVDVLTRSLAAYVPQGNTLFSGTIAENVLLGNKTASENDMIEALKRACIWDFIDSLPEKMNTVIGENGYGLSEGQAQRISIARALLSRKPVLILDEATSALDSDTELNVLNSISSLKPLLTCIMITHRKAALSFCDRILILENGNVRESSGLEEPMFESQGK